MKKSFELEFGILILLMGQLYYSTEAINITTELGHTVVLVCQLKCEYPEWLGPPYAPYGTPLTKGREVIAEGMMYVNKKDLSIAKVMTSQAGQYHCRYNGSDVAVNLVVNSYNYSITFDNVRTNIVPYNSSAAVIAAPLNKIFNLTCTVKNAFPQPSVSIIIKESNIVIQPSGIKITTKLGHGYTYTVHATISFNVTRTLDRNRIECTAKSGNISKTKSELLRVISPPLLKSIIGAGDMDSVNDHGQFKCETMNTWPLTTVHWSLAGTSSLPGRFTETRQVCKMGQNFLYNCSSTLVVKSVTKEDNGKSIICHHTFMGQPAGSQSLPINFHFPPTLVKIESNGHLSGKDGYNVTVTCSTNSANEANHTSGVSFKWKIGTTLLPVTVINRTDAPGKYNGYIATETATFPVSKNMHNQKVVCLARNFDSPGQSYIEDSRIINVAYSPVLILPYNNVVHAYEGLTIRVTCAADSNPVSHIKWVRKGVILDNDSYDNTLDLILNSTQKGDAGPYICIAENGILPSTKKAITLLVYEEPQSPILFPKVNSQSSANIRFSTSQIAPDIPRQFYVEFKVSDDDEWTEIETPNKDTEEGQSSRLIEFELRNLVPGTSYEVRLKSIDLNGLIYYTNSSSFETKDTEKMKSLQSYKNGILAAFFVPFSLLIICIGAIVFICYRVRKGLFGDTKMPFSSPYR